MDCPCGQTQEKQPLYWATGLRSFDLIILRKTSILPRGERGSLPANRSLRKMLSGLLCPSVLTIQCLSDGSLWRQRLRNLQSRGGFEKKIASLQGKASQVNPPAAQPRASGLSPPSLQCWVQILALSIQAGYSQPMLSLISPFRKG